MPKMSLLRSFIYFFVIFFSLHLIYRFFTGEIPSKNFETFIITPFAIIFAFCFADIFNQIRSRNIRKE